MDKDTVKGNVDDAVGRAKRQVGEWTGDTKTQVDGAAQQVKGKAEKAWGNMKDSARDMKAEHDAKTDAERERDRHAQAERDREHAVQGSGRG